MVRGGRQGRQGPGVQQGHTLLQDTSDHRLPLRSASSLRTKDNDHQGTTDSVENDMQNRSEVPSRLQSKSASSAFPCLTVTEPAGDGRTGVSASAGHAPSHGGEETRGHRGSGISEGGVRRRGDPSWCTGGWGQASWPRARGRGADGRVRCLRRRVCAAAAGTAETRRWPSAVLSWGRKVRDLEATQGANEQSQRCAPPDPRAERRAEAGEAGGGADRQPAV